MHLTLFICCLCFVEPVIEVNGAYIMNSIAAIGSQGNIALIFVVCGERRIALN